MPMRTLVLPIWVKCNNATSTVCSFYDNWRGRKPLWRPGMALISFKKLNRCFFHNSLVDSHTHIYSYYLFKDKHSYMQTVTTVTSQTLFNRWLNHQKTQYSLWDDTYVSIFIMCLITSPCVSWLLQQALKL